MNRSPLLFCLFAVLGWAATASAQVFPFLLRAQQGENVATLPNGATLTIPADQVGQTVLLRITATYRGVSDATILQTPDIFGSTAFTLTSTPTAPTTLNPANALNMEVRFVPTSSASVSAQIVVVYRESPPPDSPANTPPTTGLITINLVGTAPDLALSYFFQADSNVLPLPNGSTITFPPTPVNGTSQATIGIRNRGTAAGLVSSVTVSGSSFQALGVPLLPGQLDANSELRFLIRYSPKEIETATGSLRVVFGDRTITVNLEAFSTGAKFEYEILQNGQPAAVLPNQSISLPDAPVGESSSLTIQVINTGNGEGVVNSIIVAGTGFLLADLPLAPVTVPPRSAFTFSVTFSPTQPGLVRGRLRVGSDAFDLAANGIGARLAYSYTSGTTTVATSPGGSVFFSPLAIGQSARTTFTVRNAGTAPANIASVGILTAQSPFSVQNVPPLPATLEPEASFEFVLVFTPQSAAFSNGTLRIDAATFSLSGSATDPPSLPQYRFAGSSGTVEPLQQLPVGLALVSSYPLALNGILSLNVEPDGPIGIDPAVQFATGSRSVSFVIPANTTQAQFVANNSTQILLQTGSVAGTIVLTASFTLPGSDSPISQNIPSSLRMTVPGTAPRLFGVSISGRSINQFELVFNGLVTTKTMTKLDLELTPAGGFNVPTTRLSLNIEAQSQFWFRSMESEAFGGLFVLRVPFSLAADRLDAIPVNSIQSISAVLSNERGASNPVSVSF